MRYHMYIASDTTILLLSLHNTAREQIGNEKDNEMHNTQNADEKREGAEEKSVRQCKWNMMSMARCECGAKKRDV